MDPLYVVFVPGGYAAAAMVYGTPLLLLSHWLWRRRARRLLARHACGHCARSLSPDADQFLVTGIRICEPCAHSFRRALHVALPIVAISAAVFAVTSTSAFLISLRGDGPKLAWWLDWRWIALLLPSVGLAGATAAIMSVAKWANRVAARPEVSRLS